MPKDRRPKITELFNDLVRECRMTGNDAAETMLTKLYESIEGELQTVDAVKGILGELNSLGSQASQYL